MESDSLNQYFTFCEYLSITYYRMSEHQTTLPFFVLTELKNPPKYDYETLKKTIELLYQRHETLRAHHKFNDDGSVERQFDDNYTPKVDEMVVIEGTTTSPEFEEFLGNLIKNTKIKLEIPSNYFTLIKTQDKVLTMYMTHNSFTDFNTVELLHKEGLYIYNQLLHGVDIEEVKKNVLEVVSFNDYLKYLQSETIKREPKCKEYLEEKLSTVDVSNNCLKLYEEPFGFTTKIFKIDLEGTNVEKILQEKEIKMENLMKTLFQISLYKVSNVNIAPIYNTDISRPDEFVTLANCQTNYHPFIVKVNGSITLEEQIKLNEEESKKVKDLFGFINSPMIAYDLAEKEGLLGPSFLYWFVDQPNDTIRWASDLIPKAIAANDDCHPFNGFYKMVYEKNKMLYQKLIFRDSAFTKEEQEKILNFIPYCVSNLESLLETKIDQIN